MTNAVLDKSKLAKTDDEYLALLDSDADWIIRSVDDLRQRRGIDGDPLSKLSEADFREFVNSLEFKMGGVGGGSYKALMSSLTIAEILEVFERFGMSREYALANHEYECSGGALKFSFWSFCSSTCAAVKLPAE